MLAFLLDENTHGGLAKAFRRRARLGTLPAVDVIRVGDPNGPPLGIQDTELMIWAEEHDRIIVSHDKRTLPGHLQKFLASGRHSPGILFLKPGTGIGQLIDELVLISEACTPDEFRDRVQFIPH